MKLFHDGPCLFRHRDKLRLDFLLPGFEGDSLLVEPVGHAGVLLPLNGQFSERLWRLGYGHYGKPFGYHGVESIIRNPAYIGKPAWGKLGVGEYRITLDKKPTAIKRKKDDTLTMKKDEEHWIYPLKTVFPPIVPTDLFDRVKKKLANRPHKNESFGKRRTRDKSTHPLNGKLFCPDCNAPMVLGSFTPGKKSLDKTKGKAKKKHCFVCGTYRKTIRTKCHANTVAWDKLDAATNELLKLVADRITAVEQGDMTALQQSEWLTKSELGRTILTIAYAVLGKGRYPDAGATSALHDAITKKMADEMEVTLETVELEDGTLDKPLTPSMFDWAFRFYDKEFTAAAEPLRKELDTINNKLDAIADELRTYLVFGRSELRLIPVLHQGDLTIAVRLQDAPVRRLRVLRSTEPINRVHGVLDTDTANRHPFGGRRQFRRVVPVQILSEVEPATALVFRLAETKQEFEMVQTTNGVALDPRPADVDDERTLRFQNPLELPGELQEPFDVIGRRDVAVPFLPQQGERR